MAKVAIYRGKHDRIAVELLSVDVHKVEHVNYAYFPSWEGADRWAATINEPLSLEHDTIFLPFLYARICR